MFPFEPRPHNFMLPLFLIVLGGVLSVYVDRPNVTILTAALWIFALLLSLWLIAVSVLAEMRRVIDADTERMEVAARTRPGPEKVQVVRETGPTRWKYDFLPASPDRLRHMALQLANGRPFTVRAMTGRGNLFGEEEFDRLRAELLSAGYIVPRSEKDERQGVEWTETGKELLNELVRTEN